GEREDREEGERAGEHKAVVGDQLERSAGERRSNLTQRGEDPEPEASMALHIPSAYGKRRAGDRLHDDAWLFEDIDEGGGGDPARHSRICLGTVTIGAVHVGASGRARTRV